jgi:hypothetical protein
MKKKKTPTDICRTCGHDRVFHQNGTCDGREHCRGATFRCRCAGFVPVDAAGGAASAWEKLIAKYGPGSLPPLPPIDHPAHYGGDTTYEAIKVIEAWELGFRLGNAIKYISRAGKKDPAKLVEDLEKARWYLDREIATLKKGGM